MKRRLSLLLALFLCLSLFACGKKPVSPPVTDAPPEVQDPAPAPPQPETPPAEEPAPDEPQPDQPQAPQAPVVTLRDVIVVTTNETDNQVFQLTTSLPACESLPVIDGYYRAMSDDLAAIYAPTRVEASERCREYTDAGLDFLPWTAEITATVTRNDGVTLSVLREVYENFGGAYPLITYQAETFDLASQGRLLLGNLFTVPEEDYLPRLRDMILAQMAQKETESGVVYYEYAREQLMSLLDPMDFALTGDSLLIFYNEYVLAPHAAGLQHFYLPLEQLSDIVKPQYLAE